MIAEHVTEQEECVVHVVEVMVKLRGKDAITVMEKELWNVRLVTEQEELKIK